MPYSAVTTVMTGVSMKHMAGFLYSVPGSTVLDPVEDPAEPWGI